LQHGIEQGNQGGIEARSRAAAALMNLQAQMGWPSQTVDNHPYRKVLVPEGLPPDFLTTL
jgi:hypothetical protein